MSELCLLWICPEKEKHSGGLGGDRRQGGQREASVPGMEAVLEKEQFLRVSSWFTCCSSCPLGLIWALVQVPGSGVCVCVYVPAFPF